LRLFTSIVFWLQAKRMKGAKNAEQYLSLSMNGSI